MPSDPQKSAAAAATLAPAISTPAHPMAAPEPEVGPDYSPLPLRTLKLRPGMFMQSQRLVKQAERLVKDSPNYEAQFLGAIEDKCLFLVPVGTFSIKTGMRAGETFVIRGFTGQYDFQFTAKVIQAFDFTFREPAYAYAVLEYPERVHARKVRNSLRIRTSMPVSATPRTSLPAAEATIIDLSVDGALLRSEADLGSAGDLVSLAFSIGSDEDLVYVEALARICHRRIGDDGVLSGVLFETIADRDRLRIREFVLDAVE